MTIIKCLLTIVLLLVISQSCFLQDNTAVNIKVIENVYRLPSHVAPHHYDIKLILHFMEDEENFTFDGEASIVLEVFKPTFTIALHILKLTINESETTLSTYILNGNTEMCCRFSFIPKQHEYNSSTQVLTMHFDEQLDPTQTYELRLKFTGLIEKDEFSGFFRTFYIDNEGNKIWLVATKFQAVYARKVFPCWDEPAIKATFKFSIKHYPNYTALSNMPSTRSEVNQIDGKLWTYFETTPIMSTNILGFVIADYDFIAVLNGITKVWGPKHLVKNATSLLYVAETATRELERFTNSTVNLPKMDHVAVPRYPVIALESWGMIAYKQNVLLEEKPLTHKFDNVIIIVHELAHQWFGNLVSPAWWDYVWLSEGMSTYLSYYIADTIYKEWRLKDLFVARNVLSMLSLDSNCFLLENICKPININITGHVDVKNAFSQYAYIKSGALLRMVSHFLREDVFQMGLIKYLQKHRYSNVTPDDLWEALQDAHDESNVTYDYLKIKEMMDTWFNQPAYPVVRIDRDYYTGKIIAKQHKRVHFWNITEAEGNNAWWIPLNYITQSNLNSSSTLATHWLTPRNKGIIIEGVDKEDWIIVNKQLTGYYRVNYDIHNWKRIADFLNSDDYDKIPILNRAQIIDDVYYMMETEGLDCRIFFDIIKYLRHEIDLTAWYPALRVIQSLAISYLRIPRAATFFKPYFFSLTYNLYQLIGFDNQSNDNSLTKKIRLEFAKFACLYNIHPECREKAIVKLLAYVENPFANKISSDQEYLLCFGLLQASESIWNQFLIWNQLRMPSANVKFLGCSENLNIIEMHFDILKKDYSCRDLFLIMLENLPINVDVSYIIFRHYDEVAAEFDMLNKNPLFVTSFHKKILNYLREKDIEKIKRLIQNRTIFLNNEYLDDRMRQLRKIYDNLLRVFNSLENNQTFICNEHCSEF